MSAQIISRKNHLEPDADVARAVEQVDTSIDLSVFLRTFSQGKRTIGTATIVGLVLALAVAFLITPRYTSTASFIPPSTGGSTGAAAIAGQLSQLSSFGAGSILGSSKSSGDLYVGILKSRSIQSELVKSFNLQGVYKVKKQSQAEKILSANSLFVVGTKDSIVSVSVTDTRPERARDLTNAYIHALEKANDRLALSESSQRKIFFGQQLAREKNDLEIAEVELKKTEEQSGLIAPSGQTATEIQILAQTRAQIALRQVQLSTLRQSATEQNPEVVRLKTEISSLQGQLSRLQTGTNQKGNGAIPISKAPALVLDYVRKTREVKYHEALFEMLSRQYESAQIDHAREAPLLQVLDSASYPDTKSSPARMLITLTGLFAGFLAGSGWVMLQGRIRSSLMLPEISAPDPNSGDSGTCGKAVEEV